MYYQVANNDVLGVTKCLDDEIFMWVGTINGDGNIFITGRDFGVKFSIRYSHSEFMNIDVASRIELHHCVASTHAVTLQCVSTCGAPIIMSGRLIVPSNIPVSTYEFIAFSVEKVLYQIPKYLRDLFELPRVRELDVASGMIIRYMYMHQVLLLPELVRVIVLMCCELYRRLDYTTYTVS